MELAEKAKKKGGFVLVYATHTETRGITERKEDFLPRQGYQAAMMKAEAVPPEWHEVWVADRVKKGVAVLIRHPRLVQTASTL